MRAGLAVAVGLAAAEVLLRHTVRRVGGGAASPNRVDMPPVASFVTERRLGPGPWPVRLDAGRGPWAPPEPASSALELNGSEISPP
ncbi:hypothetical protein ADL27_23370 [Streptomyces sp. NRRL F-6602]|nr:hypothetical protein ADL27_23370 [Streptomyces sp. NRRL F-6602]